VPAESGTDPRRVLRRRSVDLSPLSEHPDDLARSARVTGHPGDLAIGRDLALRDAANQLRRSEREAIRCRISRNWDFSSLHSAAGLARSQRERRIPAQFGPPFSGEQASHRRDRVPQSASQR
jgi:hypothetical protein